MERLKHRRVSPTVVGAGSLMDWFRGPDANSIWPGSKAMSTGVGVKRTIMMSGICQRYGAPPAILHRNQRQFAQSLQPKTVRGTRSISTLEPAHQHPRMFSHEPPPLESTVCC